MISRRAQTIFAKPSRIFQAHRACSLDPFDAARNPTGYINLGTAENRLVWDLLKDKIASCHDLKEADSHYSTNFGTPDFRRALAGFLDRVFLGGTGQKTNPDNVIVANGVTTLVDMLGYALCDPGEAFLIPTPYYSGFDLDLDGRSKVAVVPVPLVSENGFRLTREALEAAHAQALADGKVVRAVLVTTPGNPLGRALSTEEVSAARAFAKEHDLHCIVDEIYALSCFSGTTFESVLPHVVQGAETGEKLHFLYGMSKDFALAGFRVGIFYSEHAAVSMAMKQLCYFNNISASTQRVLTGLLSDADWVEQYCAENRRRLERARDLIFDRYGAFCKFATTNAGFFVWADFREHLTAPTFEAEAELYDRIFGEAKVNFLPGAAFHAAEPGWFRICFANHEAAINESSHRLARLFS